MGLLETDNVTFLLKQPKTYIQVSKKKRKAKEKNLGLPDPVDDR